MECRVISVPYRDVARGWAGWTMSRGPPIKTNSLVWGSLNVPCSWAPEGLAAPVVPYKNIKCPNVHNDNVCFIL